MRIPLSPYRIQNPLRPENYSKITIWHPGPVLKNTEKVLRSVIFSNLLVKNYTSYYFFGNFQDRPGVDQIVIFGDFRARGGGFCIL